MNISYRKGSKTDLAGLKKLAIKSWQQFEKDLTTENWKNLSDILIDDNTYSELLDTSHCIISATEQNEIVGMAFLVPKGNPTDIYDKEWCYIRFVSVDPDFGGHGIGKKLTALCIEIAQQNNEKVIALHTSEIMGKARHIYESLGFKILKEIDQRLGKRYWLYTLDLIK